MTSSTHLTIVYLLRFMSACLCAYKGRYNGRVEILTKDTFCCFKFLAFCNVIKRHHIQKQYIQNANLELVHII